MIPKSAAILLGILLGESICAESDGQEMVNAWLCPWPGEAQAAVSITFDDAYPSHIESAIPLLEECGFRGTFYLIVDKLFQRGKYRNIPSPSVEMWQAASRCGHEIGSHTLTHAPLDTLDQDQLLEELRASQEALEGMFPGVRVVSLAYPFSRADLRVMQLAGSLYTSGRLGPPPPGTPFHNDPGKVDLLGLRSLFLCGGESPELWNDAVDRATRDQGWLVETLHPIDEEGYCQVRAEDFAAHLAYLSRLGGIVWVAPVAEVAERVARWRQISIVIIEQSASEIALQWAGTPSAGYNWQVVVKVAEPRAWRIVDSSGRRVPARVQNDTLHFAWLTEQDAGAMRLERDKESTAAVSATWGQLKGMIYSSGQKQRGVP